MDFIRKSVLLTVATALSVAGCKAGKEPNAPEEQTEFSEGDAGAISGSSLPIGSVEGQEIVLGKSPGEVPSDSAQGNVQAGNNQPSAPTNGAPGAGTPATPTPTPTPVPPPPFYPASCAEIKKAKPDAVSGVFKIYLNAAL